MSQLNYDKDQPVALEGMLADSGDRYIISRNAEVALPYGKLAIEGTDTDEQAKLPTVATDITDAEKVLGVIHRDGIKENTADSEAQYEVGDDAGIVRSGNPYIKPETAVTTQDPVYVRFNAPGSEVLGSFRNDADGGNAALLANAKFMGNVEAGELVKLRITK
jgi:hypothetical protein